MVVSWRDRDISPAVPPTVSRSGNLAQQWAWFPRAVLWDRLTPRGMFWFWGMWVRKRWEDRRSINSQNQGSPLGLWHFQNHAIPFSTEKPNTRANLTFAIGFTFLLCGTHAWSGTGDFCPPPPYVIRSHDRRKTLHFTIVHLSNSPTFMNCRWKLLEF